jgi:ABC-type amino acid transport substrate-binding protein
VTKPIFCAIGFFILFSFFCAAAPYEIAAEDDAGLWSQKDGTGLANEIVAEAFRAVKAEFKQTVMPYSRAKKNLLEGGVVACFSMSKNPELERLLIFAEKPLFVCQSDFFQNVKSPVPIKSDGTFPSKTSVGTVLGYEYPGELYARDVSGFLLFEDTASEELNLKKLAAGRIRLAVINNNATKPAELLLYVTGTFGKVESVKRCGDMGSYIAFSKKHPLGAKAAQDFNRGFSLIEADGRLKAIELRWEEVARMQVVKMSQTLRTDVK